MNNFDVIQPSSLTANEVSISDSDRRRALFGSAVGSTIEWYDYFLYGTMSSIVFAELFFPSTDALRSQLLALASFALAFLIRPLGGIFFSHVGDRIGRKKTLAITLSMMGLSTVLMGLIPTYSQIGVWAPITLTLLRLAQGFALGGEWGGGVLLAVEYSPATRRGFYGAVPQTGGLLGLALGNIITSALTSSMSREAFISYGWRIPFLASIVLVAVGIWVRNRVDETPSFKKILSSHKAVKLPLVRTLKYHWREVLIAVGTKVVEASTFFLYATFSVSYMIGLGYAKSQALNVVLLGATLALPAMLLFGHLSDRFGRRRVFVLGVLAFIVWVMPYFWLLNQHSLPAAILAVVAGFALVWSSYGALIGTLLAEAFPSTVRYTGISLGYQIGAALVGGPMALIATALIAHYGGSYVPVCFFLIGCGILSIISVALTRDRTGHELDD